jgi:hypothetical protein
VSVSLYFAFMQLYQLNTLFYQGNGCGWCLYPRRLRAKKAFTIVHVSFVSSTAGSVLYLESIWCALMSSFNQCYPLFCASFASFAAFAASFALIASASLCLLCSNDKSSCCPSSVPLLYSYPKPKFTFGPFLPGAFFAAFALANSR